MDGECKEADDVDAVHNGCPNEIVLKSVQYCFITVNAMSLISSYHSFSSFPEGGLGGVVMGNPR